MTRLVQLSGVGLAPAGFADKLVWLTRFGKPVVGVYTAGWNASISMNTNTTGASFDVKSDFRMTGPEAAVDQLIQRMIDTLKALTP